MRVTPLLCFQCGNWFQPKTKRKTKFCCNACRQANHLKKNKIYFNVFSTLGNKVDYEALHTTLELACDNEDLTGSDRLLYILNHDYDKYCKIIYKWGVDHNGLSLNEWKATL